MFFYVLLIMIFEMLIILLSYFPLENYGIVTIYECISHWYLKINYRYLVHYYYSLYLRFGIKEIQITS